METDYVEIAGIILFFLGIALVVVVDIIKGRSGNGPKDNEDPYFFKVTHRTVHHPGGIDPLAPALSNCSLHEEMTRGGVPFHLDPDYYAPWPHETNPNIAPPIHISQKYTSDH